MTQDELTFKECMEDAIDAIKDAMGKLDLGFAICPSCKSKRYSNFADKKEGDTMSNSLMRLQSILVTHEQHTPRTIRGE